MDLRPADLGIPSPPCLTPPLRVAIVGRPGAGKTTLLSHISSAWGSHEHHSPRRQPVVRTSNFIFAILQASRLGAIASRAIGFLSGIRRFFRNRAECTTVSLANSGVVVDPVCGNSVVAVALALNQHVDVVFFVIRLDDARESRADRVLLVDLVLCFGEQVLEKTIIVFTHGRATPPADLTFKDFVRGRRDLLWQYISEMRPPVEMPRDSATEPSEIERAADGRDVASFCGKHSSIPIPVMVGHVAGTEEGLETTRQDEVFDNIGRGGRVIAKWQIGPKSRSESGDQASQPSPSGDNQDGLETSNNIPELSDKSAETATNGDAQTSTHVEGEDIGLQNVAQSNGDIDQTSARIGDMNDTDRQSEEDESNPFRIRPDKFDQLFGDKASDDMSLSGLPNDLVGKFWDVLVHPDDDRVFADPSKPTTVVVELSEACAKDENGWKTLPDGTAWLPNLLSAASRKAELSRIRKAEEEEAAERTREAAVSGRHPRFLTKLREMFQSLSKDGFRILIVEIALLVLCLQMGNAFKKAQEKRRKKRLESADEDDDVLLEMSDEEYEKLTKPSDGPPFVLYDDMGKDELPRLEGDNESEREFFGGEDLKGGQASDKGTGGEEEKTAEDQAK